MRLHAKLISRQLLHDLDTEKDPLILGQSAVLLSFWVPPEDPKGCRSNTTWLMRAIHHARDAGAHRHGGFSQKHPPSCRKVLDTGTHRNNLKRLWWSCIVRDRVIALGLRRNSLIDPDSLAAAAGSGFDALDLSDEVHGSKVYNSDAKRLLIRLFVRLARLCVILTDLLDLIPYPEDGDVWRRGRYSSEDLQRAQRVEEQLHAWDAETRSQIPATDLGIAARPSQMFQKSPTELHAHVVYLYY